ncbi:MAG: hypothetical protein AAB268_00590 [Elusimicrobiota bacterium]
MVDDCIFKNGYLTPTGVRVYSSLAHNIPGIDLDSSNDQISDLICKYGERSKSLLSEHSEDSLTFTTFHALSKLPTKDWLVDFFRAAFGPKIAAAYAPYVNEAVLRFWQPHSSPNLYLEYLAKKISREGESALKHLDAGSRVRAKQRLQKLLSGELEWGEQPTEVDVQITIGKKLIIFVEVKVYSDIGKFGTLNGTDNRNQVIRNLEVVSEVKQRLGFEDAKLVLLTLDRASDKLYSQSMRRYRGPDLRKMRMWDEVTPGWERIRKDLPHRADESPEWHQRLNTSLGWVIWPEMVKILVAGYSRLWRNVALQMDDLPASNDIAASR